MTLYQGRCVGGPLDGRDMTVRAAGGFLLADVPAGWGWTYRRDPDGTFVCPDRGGPLETDQLTAAALSEEVDVVAAPWVDVEGDDDGAG